MAAGAEVPRIGTLRVTPSAVVPSTLADDSIIGKVRGCIGRFLRRAIPV